MKTLTLTDETGKVIFQKTVHNWRVSEAGDQVHVSVVPQPLQFMKVNSYTNPPWTVLGPSHPYPTPHKDEVPLAVPEPSGGFPRGNCTILWGPKRPAPEAPARRIGAGLSADPFPEATAVIESNREFIKKLFGLPPEAIKVEIKPIEKCRCDIKNLMSTGHAPKCPEAKKR